jgi:outer membrane protein TolC
LVDLSAGYTRYSDVPEFVLTLPGGRPQSIAPNVPDGWRARASVSVPLITGGRIAGAAEAARGESYAAGNDLVAARADLVLETTTAYWNLRLQTESATVLAEAMAAYESHLVDARHRAEVGLAARNEVLAVEVERDRAELGRVQADGAAAVAEANLRRLIGAGERIVIVAADRPVDERTPPHPAADTDRSVERGAKVDTPALDSLVAIALATRPEREALASRVAAAEARVRCEQGARWPQLAAVAGYDYANPNRRITPARAEWKETWDASVNLSLPLFDSGRIAAATARARAQAEALRRQAIDLDQRIRLEVTLRGIERHTAEETVGVAERAVEAARENEKVTRDRYREGVASSSDLLDAEVRGLRAALDRTDAQARLLLARANFDRAVGKLR